MSIQRGSRLQNSFFLTLLLGSILTGCTPIPASNMEINHPTLVTQPTPTAQEIIGLSASSNTSTKPSRTVIRVGTGESGDRLNTHQMIIQAFEDKHKDVLVQMEAIAGTDYYARVMSLSEANRSPDIINIGDDYVRFFVDKGIFTSLDGPLKNTTFDSSNYLPGLLEPGQINGKQYLLPFDYSTLALYYNKKLFDAAHVPYPTEYWNWNDLLSAARRLTFDKNQDGIPEQWGIQMNANWETGFEYWVAAAGGKLISVDGKKIIGYMDSPETIRALQFYADLYHKYRVTPPPADINAWAGGNSEFENGTAAMIIFGRWPQAGYLLNPKIDLGITAPPRDKVRANILFWNGCGISSSSENTLQSAEFLSFYTGEGSAEFWQDEHLPVLESMANQPSQLGELIDKVWLNELNHLVPRSFTFTPYWEETVRVPLRDALSIVVLDPKADVAQVLKNAARQAQKDLDAFNK